MIYKLENIGKIELCVELYKKIQIVTDPITSIINLTIILAWFEKINASELNFPGEWIEILTIRILQITLWGKDIRNS